MRIVHIVSYFQPQMGYQEYYLAKEHQNAGHEVFLVTADRYAPYPDYKNTAEPILGKRIKEAGTFTEFGITVIRLPVLFEIASRVWLKHLHTTLEDLKADVIICHGMANINTFRMSYASITKKTRWIVDDHMTRNLVRPGTVSNLFYFLFRTFIKQKIENRASKLVGVYNDTVEILINKMGFDRNKVQWITMGSDTEVYYPDEALRSSAREELQVGEEKLLIYTGKVNESKMVHLLLQVLNDACFDAIPHTVLVIGGVAKSYQAVWEAAVKAAKCRVIYKPPVQGSELQKWFNAADIAVWPAHTTISSLDAAACGCAIICPDYIAERVAYRNGIAVKEGDEEDLKNALYKMLGNDELLQDMRCKSIQSIREFANWKSIARRFLE